MACPGFLTVADIKGDVGATRDALLNGVGRQSNGFHTRDPILTQVCFLRHSAGKMLEGQHA
jgi:hypothetical protein